MMDPGMMSAPMPPAGPPAADPMMGGGMPAPMNPVEAVVMALKGMEVQRKGENDALMMAVLQATGAMPNGLGGVAEGAPMAVPGDAPVDPAMGGY